MGSQQLIFPGLVRSALVSMLLAVSAAGQSPMSVSSVASINNLKNAAYCADTSVSANTITCSTAVGFTGYVAGQSVDVLMANTVSGATTISINGLGAKAVTVNGAASMTNGVMQIGGAYRLTYDGTEFVLEGSVNLCPAGGAGQIQFTSASGTCASSSNFTFVATTGTLTHTGGIDNFSGDTHTATLTVVANVGALPATGCINGELAIVTAATLGQQIYENSGTGACAWTQQLNTGSSSGGGITVYAAAALLAGTQYIPIGGGAQPSGTETNVQTAAPSSATITNFEVQMSAAPGAGNSVVFTWRKAASSQSLTCTISGAVATSCSDNADSFNVSQGDLVDIQLVTTGTVAGSPYVVTSAQFGTTGSNGTVNASTLGAIAYYAAAGTAVSGAGITGIVSARAATGAPLGRTITGTAPITVTNGDGTAGNPTIACSTCTTSAQLHSIAFVIDGGGSAIATGDAKTYPTAAFACTINRIDISADQSGSITVDVWKAAGAIPTSGNKISASAPLTLSSAQLAQNGSLSGWTTGVSSGDVFGFNVATATTVTRVVGQIWCQ